MIWEGKWNERGKKMKRNEQQPLRCSNAFTICHCIFAKEEELTVQKNEIACRRNDLERDIWLIVLKLLNTSITSQTIDIGTNLDFDLTQLKTIDKRSLSYFLIIRAKIYYLHLPLIRKIKRKKKKKQTNENVETNYFPL